MKKQIVKTTLILALTSQCLSAAGLWLYEGATPEMGTAGAGRGAVADSAAISLFNPAGMTRLKEDQLMMGIQPMYVDAKFNGVATDASSNQETGSNGGNAGGFVPAAAFYYVNSYSDRLKFGFSSASYFGLGVDYGEDWKGRYFTTEASMLTLAMTPTVAYKLTDTISIGFAFNILYSELKQTIVKRRDESKFELKEDDFGYGYSLSTLYEPTKDLRFGLVYTSSVTLEFEDLEPNDDLSITMDTPQSLTLSGFYQLNNKWALLSSLGWQEWSEFGTADVNFDGDIIQGSTVDDRNFDDTYHFSVGTHYNYSQALTLMTGIAYDSSPVEDEYRTIDMPLDRQIRYAFGATYDYSKQITIGMAYELLDAGKAKVNQDAYNLSGTKIGNINGEFDTNYVHIFNININYKF